MSEKTKGPEEHEESKPAEEPRRGGCCGGGALLSAKRASAKAGEKLGELDKLLEECMMDTDKDQHAEEQK